jgi:hypothetical protein
MAPLTSLFVTICNARAVQSYRLPDRHFVALGDLRLPRQLALECAVIPPKQTGELSLPARSLLVVEGVADGPQLGGGHQFATIC